MANNVVGVQATLQPSNHVDFLAAVAGVCQLGWLHSQTKYSVVRWRLRSHKAGYITFRISNLIGQGLPCHGSRCRFESDLIRVLGYIV